MKKNIVIGITGGIAAYKILDLSKKLIKNDFIVYIIMTESASRIVPPDEFKKINIPVFTELFPLGFDKAMILKKRSVEHIRLADIADIMLIAPATANTIAKISHGIADNLLTTVSLATKAPVIICPSMNVHMWENPLTQENIKRLSSFGYDLVHPDEGDLACGYTGVGRLPEIDRIYNKVTAKINYTNILAGKNIVITAGATREYIDDIRYITNASSGKMGRAIAFACKNAGANTLLLSSGEDFHTVDQLWRLLKKHIARADICIHTAAIGDFLVKNKFTGKLKSGNNVQINLEPQQKLASRIKKLNPNITLIVFKAEWGGSKKIQFENAYNTLIQHSADAVVLNDVSKKNRGFNSDSNKVTIILPNRRSYTSKQLSKEKIAHFIIEKTIEKLHHNI